MPNQFQADDPVVYGFADIHPSITLTFTFFRGDLRTSLTSDVEEEDTLKPWDQCEHEPKK